MMAPHRTFLPFKFSHSVLGLIGFSFIYQSWLFEEPLVPDPYYVIFQVMADVRFWLLLLLVPVIAVGPRMLVMYVRNGWWFSHLCALRLAQSATLHHFTQDV